MASDNDAKRHRPVALHARKRAWNRNLPEVALLGPVELEEHAHRIAGLEQLHRASLLPHLKLLVHDVRGQECLSVQSVWIESPAWLRRPSSERQRGLIVSSTSEQSFHRNLALRSQKM